MKNGDARSNKKRLAAAAAVTGVLLCLMTFFFINDVKKQLWDQSVNTIMEATRQGCKTLKVQLNHDFEAMEGAAEKLQTVFSEDKDQLNTITACYGQLENGICLYLEDGAWLTSETNADEEVVEALAGNDRAAGIINPHISSVTGVNVFNLFTKVALKDGTAGYLVKEYEISSIVDSFSLSFYNDAGFSYVVNTRGDVLIRPSHPGSNKTVKNLFDMLPESENDPESLEEFALSLEKLHTGYAVFTYQGERTVFCYIPLELQSDWYLISIIPEDVVNAQTREILSRAFALIGGIIAGIALLVACYIWYVNTTNRKLRNQANYIGHLYNAIPEGIALLTVDAPYSLIQLNDEGLRLLGFPQGTLNDAPKGKLLMDAVYQEDYPGIEQILQDTAKRGVKNVLELRARKADGGFFWTAVIVEKTLDENGVPVLIAAFHDITAEKQVQEAAEREKLQERLTLVGAISKAYPVIISVNLTSDSLNYIYVQHGLMMKVGEQKTYSQLFEDMSRSVDPENKEVFRTRFAPENLRRILGHEKNEVFLDARQMMADGTYHWTSTQIIYVDNPYSKDRLAIIISRRIDEQRYEEEQRGQALQSALDNARAANEAKSQFLSNMSHDIRTPMNAIVGMTAIAAAHLEDRERTEDCLKKISLSSKYLLSLINDILDMSKIESGKVSLREEPFNFAELAAGAVELIRSQALAKQLKLDARPGLLENENVTGDPLRIRQIFINILSNAVKYTPEGGSIRIEIKQECSIRRGYQSYVFRCADTGMGMDGEFLARLFQPFERAQDSTTSRIGGTGLGMAITKNLIDLMNGDICVESEPGKGSVFTVTLPLLLQERQREEVPAEWMGMRCIIVDDDQEICENAVEILKDIGLRTQFAISGREAVRMVVKAGKTRDPFQLVIVDWKMPDMGGVEVARRIREEVGSEIPVIVLTAYDWAEIENEAKEAGVTAFISKPFYRSKICYLLEELSGAKEQTRHLSRAARPDYSDRRLLLVEDNELNREIVREMISETGIEIEEAMDGEEAVRKVAESEEGYYDLILMDIQMPLMDGYEATKAIRGLDREDVRKLPIIAMTANAYEEDVRAALRAGMDAHFAKPIDMENFEHILRRFLPE